MNNGNATPTNKAVVLINLMRMGSEFGGITGHGRKSRLSRTSNVKNVEMSIA